VRALYLVSVWIHVLAAMAWIGGMFFLVLVVVPWLRRGGRENAGAFLRETGERFRAVGWACFAVLTVTGTFNLWVRGVRLSSFADPDWRATDFGRSVVLKLLAFALVVAVSGYHDFFVGPQAAAAIERREPTAEPLRRRASLLGRVNALLALGLVAIAVTLVRGCG
jgi:uncharacterized membrane protein